MSRSELYHTFMLLCSRINKLYLYTINTIKVCWILATYFDQGIQGASRDMDDFARYDILGLCTQRSSYKHMSDFERLRRCHLLELRIEGRGCGNDVE